MTKNDFIKAGVNPDKISTIDVPIFTWNATEKHTEIIPWPFNPDSTEYWYSSWVGEKDKPDEKVYACMSSYNELTKELIEEMNNSYRVYIMDSSEIKYIRRDTYRFVIVN